MRGIVLNKQIKAAQNAAFLLLLCCFQLKRPVAVFEYRNALTVRSNARDVQIFTANHKVNVYHRAVYTGLLALFYCHILKPFQTFIKASSES